MTIPTAANTETSLFEFMGCSISRGETILSQFFYHYGTDFSWKLTRQTYVQSIFINILKLLHGTKARPIHNLNAISVHYYS